MNATKLASIHLLNWNILEHYNHDPSRVFKKAKLDPALMYQPGARYPLNKINDLWNEMERVIKDPCFGLSAAKGWHPSNFGLLGYALLVSNSLRTTLERLIRFHRVLSDARYGELKEDKAVGALIFELTNLDEEPFTAAREDAAIAWIMSVLMVNFQKPLSPVSVSFTHSRPEECAGKYYEFFHAPIDFEAPRASIALSLDDVDRVLPSGNKDLVEWKEQAMTKYLDTKESESLIPQVTKIIAEHLPSGDVTVEKTAAELFLSTRKLQRLLQEEGTSFLTLLNEVRKDIAEQHVKNKDMDLTEIAFLLGFSEQSTFSRSFKRWTGMSPSSFRNAV